MQVTKALIEKYHNGECSPEESAAVENWLNDGQTDDIVAFVSEFDRTAMKDKIWQEVRPVTPFYKRPVAIITAAAAALLFCLFRFLPLTTETADSPGFTIELGRESKASFNKEQGAINFCGTIKIVSQKDINLSFKTTCTDGTTRIKAIHVKEGESYIALHYKDKQSSEMLIINENMLFELPPVIKNQLSEQFKI
ncbi:hypothetical protein SAMN05428949_1088 [Chitinophaga sp. YR627]|uniref:hypothetical protein n=1 Tax=Chitinophaga sp. YR627 TaxID=1881041 RepID=UPI0008EECA7F|nr:hypothetical protein [Chitinophaga sp. YR627]SFM86329.1 hypothetical protein SAMN05428949_1088 [Chitinophaga sp. YR627]